MFTTYDLRDFIEGLAKLFALGYWGSLLLFLVIFVPLVYKMPRNKIHKILASSATAIGLLAVYFIVIPLMLGPSKQERQAQKERIARYETGKALFEQRCKTAGEKIYRTVDNVDGIMLLKVRTSKPDGWAAAMQNPMYPSAVAANEFGDMEYIAMFLNYYSYNLLKLTKTYRYIDVLQADKSIIRYEGVWKHTWKPFKETLNPKNPARYAVTFEDDVNPEDRKYWVAGTTIKVIDRQTNEILGERKSYAFEHEQGNLAYPRIPWISAEICPSNPKKHIIDYYFTTYFVHEILKPKQETQNVK